MDTTLIFPPQWSPFQPPLSIPSLRAWLKREGLNCRSVDWNIEFYTYLYSQQAKEALYKGLVVSAGEESRAHSFLLSNLTDFGQDLGYLRGTRIHISQDPLLTNHLGTRSLQAYLHAVSDISKAFEVSPYSFQASLNNFSAEEIDTFLGTPPAILQEFVLNRVTRLLSETPSNCYGISCIGQEQLIFSLLIGKCLKQMTNSPIVLGGTVFSRIHNRGVLPIHWFGKYFDLIVKNEGEKPLTAILKVLRTSRSYPSDISLSQIPNLVYRSSETGKVISTDVSSPLAATEVPVPDFDELPLDKYLSPEVTLPILSSRGCYWGKCEFCHHGMVYGEKYSAYNVDGVLNSLHLLSEKYSARSFAFNDEAIPPKVFRALGRTLPRHSSSDWVMTGLLKFEKYYSADDFQGAFGVGFRNVYVGLESASERVLSLMKKNCTQATMRQNLSDATQSGLWMHCFAFFGFPGETEEDAAHTFRFLLEEADNIGSVGCGTFSLEHDSPIQKDLKNRAQDLEVLPSVKDNINVYYRYKVREGIDHNRAVELQESLNDELSKIPRFAVGNWVPREHLAHLLRTQSLSSMTEWGKDLIAHGQVPSAVKLSDVLSTALVPDGMIVLCRINRRVILVRGNSERALQLLLESDLPVRDYYGVSLPLLEHVFSSKPTTRSENISSKDSTNQNALTTVVR